MIPLPDGRMLARLEQRAKADGISVELLLERILAAALREVEDKSLPLIVCTRCREPRRHRPLGTQRLPKGHAHLFGCVGCGTKRRYGFTGDGDEGGDDGDEA